MQSFSIRVPNINKLAEFLNRLESLGFIIRSVEFISGQTIVVVNSTTPPSPQSFLLQEDNSFILLEDNSKIVI